MIALVEDYIPKNDEVGYNADNNLTQHFCAHPNLPFQLSSAFKGRVWTGSDLHPTRSGGMGAKPEEPELEKQEISIETHLDTKILLFGTCLLPTVFAYHTVGNSTYGASLQS